MMRNANSLDWESLRCFLAVARTGSLTVAAQKLDVSIATVGRRIDGLELQLNLKLFLRSPKGLRLTDHGRLIQRHAESGERHLSQIERAARALVEGPNTPPVRISATEGVVADILAPGLVQLKASHPGIHIEMEVSNNIANLAAGNIDLAIRMARPTEDSLLARRLAPIRLGLFGSAGYFNGRSAEKIKPADETLIWLDASYGDIAENIWLKQNGLDGQVRYRSTSVRSLLTACSAGLGVAPLPVFTARDAGLIEIPSHGFPTRQPWLVFHKDTRSSERLSNVRQWVVETFRKTVGVAPR
jgi:DNA-binding transcriptional LysR family regulator